MPQVLHRVVGIVELDHWQRDSDSDHADVWHRLHQRLRFFEDFPACVSPGGTSLTTTPNQRIFVVDPEQLHLDLERELRQLKTTR